MHDLERAHRVWSVVIGGLLTALLGFVILFLVVFMNPGWDNCAEQRGDRVVEVDCGG